MPATKWETLAEHIRNQIRIGELKPGDKLPSTAQLKGRARRIQCCHSVCHACPAHRRLGREHPRRRRLRGRAQVAQARLP